jgi:rhodanese-related sulfurtransferase
MATHGAGFVRLVDDAKTRVTEVQVAEVKAKLDRGDRLQFVDVREDAEWAQDHARGARHIGRGVLERDVEGQIHDKDVEIVLYCGGGFRSALAADSLQRMGYTKVRSMAGGIRAWREAGFPLEPGHPTAPDSGSKPR